MFATVAVAVFATVAVAVFATVGVLVLVAVGVSVTVGVLVLVAVGVSVTVGVLVLVAVAVAVTTCSSNAPRSQLLFEGRGRLRASTVMVVPQELVPLATTSSAVLPVSSARVWGAVAAPFAASAAASEGSLVSEGAPLTVPPEFVAVITKFDPVKVVVVVPLFAAPSATVAG